MNAFDEETHTYTINGIKVPSVTEVISKTLGRIWYADDFYLRRGSAIHACAKMIAEGKDFDYDERIEGYVKALKRFFKEVKPEVLHIEKTMYSKKFSFAGTSDLVCKISNRLCVEDYKASFEKERLKLQLAGYALLYQENHGKVIKLGHGIKLNNNQLGTYSMTEPIDLRQARNDFLVLRNYLAIKERVAPGFGYA